MLFFHGSIKGFGSICNSRFVRGVHHHSRLCFEYICGLMSYSKSNIERMAEYQQVNSQQLRHFISVSVRDVKGVMEDVAAKMKQSFSRKQSARYMTAATMATFMLLSPSR